MVAPVTGAPSDGNRQLFSGMRRALGSSKIVIVDAAGGDIFTVVGTVNLTPIDDKRGQLDIKWVVKDPDRQEVGNIEQSNPVPLAAAQGRWAGFGDIVATAAVRRRARTARKGAQPAALGPPCRQPESACQRGVRDCYCPRQRLNSCNEDRSNRET